MKTGAAAAAALLLFPMDLPVEEEQKFSEFQADVKGSENADHGLAGVEFGVYADAECTTELMMSEVPITVISDEEGHLLFEADSEECYIAVKKPVPGYYEADGPFHLMRDEEGKIILDPVEIAVEGMNENIRIILTDEENEIILNEEEMPLLEAGKTYGVRVEDENEYHLYEEQELEVPLKKPEDILPLNIEPLARGRLSIQGAIENDLSVWQLYEDEACEEKAEYEALELNEKGRASILLKPGIYYVREEETDAAFFPDQTVHRIEISPDEEELLAAQHRPVRFMIHVFDKETGTSLPVVLTDDEKEYASEKWVPSARGTSLTLNVEGEGDYIFPESISVDIASDAVEDQLINIPVDKKPAEVSAIEDPVPMVNEGEKVSEPEAVLPIAETAAVPLQQEIITPAKPSGQLIPALPSGTKWSLYMDEAALLPALDISEAEIAGCAEKDIRTVTPGTYYVKADAVPEDCYAFDGMIPVAVSEAGTEFSIPLVKAQMAIDIHNASGEENEALLCLYDDSGVLLNQWTASGPVRITAGIKPGRTYTVKAVGHDGKILAKEEIAIPRSEPAEIPAVAIDLSHMVHMRIESHGGDEKAGGMRYELYKDEELTIPVTDEEDQTVMVETDKNGKASLDVQAGTYYLKPVDMDNHWYEEEEAIKMEAGEGDNVLKIDHEGASILFHLRDEDGRYISGSSFSLLDEDGNIVVEWTTGGKAVTIKDRSLQRGAVYVVHEKRSASGYQRLSDQKIQIPALSKEPYSVELTAAKKKTVQQIIDGSDRREDTSRTALMTAGAIALFLAIGILLVLKKRKSFVTKNVFHESK